MRGRKEKELVTHLPSESGLGNTIRSWRRFRGLSVTELALRAGFGKNGRGYISKIEHQQIKRLGEEQLVAIARALGLTVADLQQHRLPANPEKQFPDKATLDEAIIGCHAWLQLYSQDTHPLDYARTRLKLAELCWQRITLTEASEERRSILMNALQSIEQALQIFRDEKALTSYAEAQRIHSAIEKESQMQALDDAIAGCHALFKVHRREEQELDWARTHTRLAQLYRDRASHSEKSEERSALLGKALFCIDQALPIFRWHAPASYTEAQRLRQDVEGARNGQLHSSG